MTTKTPRYTLLSKTVSEAEAALKKLSTPVDYSEASAAMNSMVSDAMNCYDMFELMNRLMKLREDFPNSLVWSVPQNDICAAIKRLFVSHASFENSRIAREQASFSSLVSAAEQRLASARSELADYLSSKDYELDVMKQQLESLTKNSK